jgi:hypothetical protein
MTERGGHRRLGVRADERVDPGHQRRVSGMGTREVGVKPFHRFGIAALQGFHGGAGTGFGFAGRWWRLGRPRAGHAGQQGGGQPQDADDDGPPAHGLVSPLSLPARPLGVTGTGGDFTPPRLCRKQQTRGVRTNATDGCRRRPARRKFRDA